MLNTERNTLAGIYVTASDMRGGTHGGLRVLTL
jgi:hypothetical protein